MSHKQENSQQITNLQKLIGIERRRDSGYKKYQADDVSKVRFENHLDKLLNKNEDYYSHIEKDCICGMCICGQHRCLSFKKGLQYDKNIGQNSVYQQDFQDHLNNKDYKPAFKVEIAKQFRMDQPIDLSTTNRNDFRPHSIESGLRMHKGQSQIVTGKIPFAAFSNYQDTYLNYGANQTNLAKRKYKKTVIENLPLVGSSIYKKDYKPQQINYAETQQNDRILNNARYSQYKAPFNLEFPFMSETSTGAAFRPFKTQKNQSFKSTDIVKHAPAWKGFYDTINKKDYGQTDVKECPAKEVLTLYATKTYEKGSTKKSPKNTQTVF